MAKMAQKAMQAQKQMSKIKAAGKSSYLGVLIDGLYNVSDSEVNREELKNELDLGLDDRAIEKIAKSIEKHTKDSFNNANKALKEELKNSTNLDDLKNLFS